VRFAAQVVVVAEQQPSFHQNKMKTSNFHRFEQKIKAYKKGFKGRPLTILDQQKLQMERMTSVVREVLDFYEIYGGFVWRKEVHEAMIDGKLEKYLKTSFATFLANVLDQTEMPEWPEWMGEKHVLPFTGGAASHLKRVCLMRSKGEKRRSDKAHTIAYALYQTKDGSLPMHEKWVNAAKREAFQRLTSLDGHYLPTEHEMEVFRDQVVRTVEEIVCHSYGPDEKVIQEHSVKFNCHRLTQFSGQKFRLVEKHACASFLKYQKDVRLFNVWVNRKLEWKHGTSSITPELKLERVLESESSPKLPSMNSCSARTRRDFGQYGYIFKKNGHQLSHKQIDSGKYFEIMPDGSEEDTRYPPGYKGKWSSKFNWTNNIDKFIVPSDYLLGHLTVSPKHDSYSCPLLYGPYDPEDLQFNIDESRDRAREHISIYGTTDCKIVGLRESFKIRCITRGDPDIYNLVNGYQHALWKVVKDHPSFRLISQPIDQQYLDYLSEGWHSSPFSEDERIFVSGDYTAATDNLNPQLSNLAMETLCLKLGIPCQDIPVLVSALSQHLIEDPDVEQFDEMLDYPKGVNQYTLDRASMRPQIWGQLMGSPISFPILNIMNAAASRFAVELGRHGVTLDEYVHSGDIRNRVRLTPLSLEDSRIGCNGDDIGFVCDGKTYETWKEVTRKFGLEFSVGKNYTHPSLLILNSQMNTWKDDHLVPLPHLWSGVLFCESRERNEESEIFKQDTFSTFDATKIGCNLWTLVRMFPEKAEHLIKRFVSVNRKTLSHVPDGMSYYLPMSLGGLGMPAPKDVEDRVSPQQLKLAAYLQTRTKPVPLEWRKEQFPLYCEGYMHRMNNLAVDTLPTTRVSESVVFKRERQYDELGVEVLDFCKDLDLPPIIVRDQVMDYREVERMDMGGVMGWFEGPLIEEDVYCQEGHALNQWQSLWNKAQRTSLKPMRLGRALRYQQGMKRYPAVHCTGLLQ